MLSMVGSRDWDISVVYDNFFETEFAVTTFSQNYLAVANKVAKVSLLLLVTVPAQQSYIGAVVFLKLATGMTMIYFSGSPCYRQ